MSPFIQAVINGCCRCASEKPDWLESTPSWRTSHSWKDLSVFTHAHKKWVKGGEKEKTRKRNKMKKKKGEG